MLPLIAPGLLGDVVAGFAKPEAVKRRESFTGSGLISGGGYVFPPEHPVTLSESGTAKEGKVSAEGKGALSGCRAQAVPRAQSCCPQHGCPCCQK